MLENNGRTVITDGVHGLRKFPLKDVENAINSIDKVENADAYLYFDPEINEMSLAVNVETDGVNADEIIAYMTENHDPNLVPKVVNVK
jgi:hypothetical protein